MQLEVETVSSCSVYALLSECACYTVNCCAMSRLSVHSNSNSIVSMCVCVCYGRFKSFMSYLVRLVSRRTLADKRHWSARAREPRTDRTHLFTHLYMSFHRVLSSRHVCVARYRELARSRVNSA